MMNGILKEIHVRDKKGSEPLTEKDKRTAENSYKSITRT